MFIHSTSLLDKKDDEVEKITEKLKQMREANKGSSE
jgi:proteasome assembly chaperone (PAC2) family protein